MGTTVLLEPEVAAVVTLRPTVAAQVVLTPTIGVVGPVGGPGPTGPPGSGGDLSAVVAVSIASDTWLIAVPAGFIAAGKVPAATVYDTAGTQLNVGVVHDAIANTLTLTFSAPTAGTVSLN